MKLTNVKTEKHDFMLGNTVKQHIPVLTFLTALLIVDYSVILCFTRFLTDWALSFIPRIVFHLFCVQMIMSVIQQKLYQLRRTLKAAEDDASVLDNLEEVYIEVWELSKMINDKFQISIGVVLLQQYLDMKSCLFWSFEYIREHRLSFII